MPIHHTCHRCSLVPLQLTNYITTHTLGSHHRSIPAITVLTIKIIIFPVNQFSKHHPSITTTILLLHGFKSTQAAPSSPPANHYQGPCLLCPAIAATGPPLPLQFQPPRRYLHHHNSITASISLPASLCHQPRPNTN